MARLAKPSRTKSGVTPGGRQYFAYTGKLGDKTHVREPGGDVGYSKHHGNKYKVTVKSYGSKIVNSKVEDIQKGPKTRV